MTAMSATPQELEAAIEATRAGVVAVANGDHTVIMGHYSEADDITIGNPFGPFAKGRQATDATIANAAARYADGELTGVDRISLHTSDTLAAVVEVEHIRARLGGAAEPAEVALRVTTVFRLEPGGWKIVHRHADPITSPRATESLVQG